MTWFDPFPARNWLDRVTPTSVRSDLFAGFTNAAIVLPQGVAFATIAGLPRVWPLYRDGIGDYRGAVRLVSFDDLGADNSDFGGPFCHAF